MVVLGGCHTFVHWSNPPPPRSGTEEHYGTFATATGQHGTWARIYAGLTRGQIGDMNFLCNRGHEFIWCLAGRCETENLFLPALLQRHQWPNISSLLRCCIGSLFVSEGKASAYTSVLLHVVCAWITCEIALYRTRPLVSNSAVPALTHSYLPLAGISGIFQPYLEMSVIKPGLLNIRNM